VEGVRARVGDLCEPGLPREAPATCGMSVVRAVRASRSPSTGSLILMHTEATAIRLPAGELLTELGMSVDPELLDRALTHRSYAYEQGGLPTNERLEFLGDSVLGLIVTEHLFVTYPDLSEGQLAKLRAAVVNSRALADIARHLDLGAVIHLGRGEESTGGRDKSSILADTMEAVIGAVFLQHGIDAARGFVHHLFDPLMAEVATRGAGLDWKTSLQEIASMSGLGVPVYDVVESGPDHAKTFQATVKIDDQSYGPGAGRNKKEAEQNAAALAFAALKGSRGSGPVAPH
jgi:ribonuclease III